MDQRLVCQFDIKKGDHSFTFTFPYGVPLGDLYNAAFDVLNSVQDLGKQAVDKANEQHKSVDAEIVNQAPIAQ